MYVITLAGFNGTTPVAGPVMAKAKDSLRDLITSKKIDKPILVGHSLGATLSIWFAESHADMIRGVFAVDGLAVLPRTENMSMEQRTSTAQTMRVQASNLTQAAFAAQQVQYMEMMGVIDPQTAKDLGALSAKSNPAAFVDYYIEDLLLDLRKDLAAITVPLTIVSPYYAKDLAPIGMSEQQKTDYYKSLHVGAPKLEVVSINESRHFAMYDQPKIFAEKLQNFIQLAQ
jgi:pimeloyl-ACP methyl ester carboxylesterase